MDMNKSIIIFTTFWDAISIVDNEGFIIDKKLVQFEKDESKIYSIALSKPPIKEATKYSTLKFLCPNWGILKEYKKSRDWNSYTKSYRSILVKNKNEIASWVESLNKGIYILCCWENTSKGANCHRKILYDALISSKKTKHLSNYIYRHGDKDQYNIEKQIIGTYKYILEERGKEELPQGTLSSINLSEYYINFFNYGNRVIQL